MEHKIIRPPAPFTVQDVERGPSIFLGGTIDMGAVKPWAADFVSRFRYFNVPVVFFDPRRDDWDETWEQDPTKGTQFYEQVLWETLAQKYAKYTIYNFLPGSKSPVTMLELGACDREKTIVICPPDFWRYGNVKFFCNHSGILHVESVEKAVNTLIDWIPFEKYP